MGGALKSDFNRYVRVRGAVALNHFTTPYVYIVKTEFASREQETAWNDWYQRVHVPAMLTVPGVRACHRYVDVTGEMQYVAMYEVDSPEVFEHPRYREVTGWGEWHQYVRGWTRTILRIEQAEETFEGGAGFGVD
jgi:hypothetical protein